jgi:hypothetical protein
MGLSLGESSFSVISGMAMEKFGSYLNHWLGVATAIK